MAFWGAVVRPGAPFVHRYDPIRGRLHLSQATTAAATTPATTTTLQCNVGDKTPIFLCRFIPNVSGSCPLNLEFQEHDQVVFSVLGPTALHLSGYYLQTTTTTTHSHDDTEESYGEDIQNTESGNHDDSAEVDQDDSINDFIVNDSEEEEQLQEISTSNNPAYPAGSRKRLRKKYRVSSSDDNAATSTTHKKKSINIGTGPSIFDSETEQEDDDLPLSKPTKKRKRVQHPKTERETRKMNSGSVPFSEAGQENVETPKKKKKKERKTRGVGDDRLEEGQMGETEADKITQEEPLINDDAKEKLTNERSSVDIDSSFVAKYTTARKKKTKKSKNRTPENKNGST